jgi:NADH-quinone oxidoreductase subunit N
LVLLATHSQAGEASAAYIGSLLLAVAGVMLVATAGDLVLLFVGLELVSLTTYVLLFLGRRDAASREAAVKYFYLGVLASSILLCGFGFLYGAAGAMELRSIGLRLSAADPRGLTGLARVALALVYGGLSFRIAAVPFHFYAPGVYQGTTSAGAGFLSVVPKIAGFVALVRVAVAMPGVHAHAWRALAVLAALTMTYGNLLALWQNHLRRLLAYSSIAQSGCMLVGLSAWMASGTAAPPAWDGIGALWFCLLAYVPATLGVFAALDCLGREGQAVDHVEQLAGLAAGGGRRRPALALVLAAGLLSLTGIWPLAGFWGKFGLLFSALGATRPGTPGYPWLVTLVAVGLVNAAIAAGYYLRVVAVMFFRLPLGAAPVRHSARGVVLAALVSAALVLAVGFRPGPCIDQSNRASPRTPVGNSRAAAAAGVLP